MRFNTDETIVTINGHLFECLHVVKYLGIYIDDKLAWNYQIAHITNICCQRIGVINKVLLFLPSFVSVLYFNAFIRSCYSYCVMFWINNDRSGRFKLINNNKIDRVISILTINHHLSVNDFINKFKICDVLKVCNLQNLASMYNGLLPLAPQPIAPRQMRHAICAPASSATPGAPRHLRHAKCATSGAPRHLRLNQ
jgi:hypothetical protein